MTLSIVHVDAVCFGWFMPFFFVGIGVKFHLGAITHVPTTALLMPAFLLMLLAVLSVLLFPTIAAALRPRVALASATDRPLNAD